MRPRCHSKNLRSEVPGALFLLEIKVRSLLSKLIEQTPFQKGYLAYQTRQEDLFLKPEFLEVIHLQVNYAGLNWKPFF